MRHEWYLSRYRGAKFIDRSPYPMSKSEANSLLSLSNKITGEFTYKVEHRSEFKEFKL